MWGVPLRVCEVGSSRSCNIPLSLAFPKGSGELSAVQTLPTTSPQQMHSQTPSRRSTALFLPIGCLVTLCTALELVAQRPVEEGTQPAVTVQPTSEYRHALAPRARAARVDAPISIDGALDDAAWLDAPPITDFLQTLPFEGEAASERTEVRLAYDDVAIYIGAILDDRSPVTTRLARRDAGLDDSDVLVVLLDSYHDHETAYRFWTNPSGVKGDAIITGNSLGRGDSSWDPVWDLATEVTDAGWVVEMRIPFSQLRFSPSDLQVWGVQFERDINRNQENATFPFTPTLERAGVSRFAHVDGIEGIETGRRLELLPYVAARGEYLQLEDPSGINFANPYRSGSDHFGAVGLDLKYRITSNVTLDATVNPDFGQVELDPSIINLTAFETQYAERRPFFVEGADIFNFGEAGPMGSIGRGPALVYSRRIGRPPSGDVPSDAVFSDVPTATTIAGAAKVTGRIGDGWSLGILEAVTAKEVATYVDGGAMDHRRMVEPAANYFVGRARRQIRGGQTRFGMIASAVNRDASGTPLEASLHTSAYAGGFDFAHESADRIWLFTGLISGSRVGGGIDAIRRTQESSTRYLHRPDASHLELDPAATSLSGFYAMGYVGKQAGNFTMRNGFAAISPGYEVNDLGFHTNADRFLLDTHYQYTQPDPGRVFRSWRVFGGPDAVWNFAGDRTRANVNLSNSLTFLNYWRTTVRLQYDPWNEDDRLTRGGPIARSPARKSVTFRLNSDGRRAAVGSGSFTWGSDEAGGWSRGVQLSLNARFQETLQISVGPSYSWFRSAAQYVTRVGDPLATQTFETRYVFADLKRSTLSLETRVNLTFSPTLSLQMYVEPFISTGDYGALKEFRAPGTFDFLEYGRDVGTVVRTPEGEFEVDPDGDDPAPSFPVSDRDFSYRSLLGNAVLRWEWRPGSTLFFVWQQRRIDSVTGHRAPGTDDWVGTFDLGRDTGDIFDVAPDNIFMIKVNYWLNP